MAKPPVKPSKFVLKCSITPAVSPRVQHVIEPGKIPVITLAPGTMSESNWESIGQVSKRAVIRESDNEVIEIPTRLERPWQKSAES